MSRDGLELALVGCEQRRTAVFLEVAPFRVDQHRHPGLAAQRDHLPDVGQRTLAVIGKHDGAGACKCLAQGGDERAVVEFGGVLLVEPYQLLAAALHACLGDRRAIADPRKRAVYTVPGQQGLQCIGRGIVADRADEPGYRAQRREVHGDVGCPARPVVGLLHVHDRHRRLGRDAVRGAEQVLVQHHVAGDDDLCP